MSVCVNHISQLHPPQTAVAPADFFSRDLTRVLINITTASLAILSQLNHASCKTDVFFVFPSLVKWIIVCPAPWVKECGHWGSRCWYYIWKYFMSSDDSLDFWEISDKSRLQVSLHRLFQASTLITFTFKAFRWWLAAIFVLMLSVPITACTKYYV